MLIAPPCKSEGIASGIMKWIIVYKGEAPIEVAASIMPGFTSFRDDSTIRATIGMAPTVRGTIDAVVPIEEPTTSLVKGIKSTSRIRNGSERATFTMNPMMPLTILFSRRRPFEVA